MQRVLPPVFLQLVLPVFPDGAGSAAAAGPSSQEGGGSAAASSIMLAPPSAAVQSACIKQAPFGGFAPGLSPTWPQALVWRPCSTGGLQRPPGLLKELALQILALVANELEVRMRRDVAVRREKSWSFCSITLYIVSGCSSIHWINDSIQVDFIPTGPSKYSPEV